MTNRRICSEELTRNARSMLALVRRTYHYRDELNPRGSRRVRFAPRYADDFLRSASALNF